jgi:hypothetical protein
LLVLSWCILTLQGSLAVKDQFSITLDAYHKWAIDQIAEVMGVNRTELILWAVRDWVAKNPNHVSDAKATLSEFRNARTKELG